MSTTSHYSPETIRALEQNHLWHPFTDMIEYLRNPGVIIARGQGVQLQDIDGRWYYDGVSSVWLNVHGHHVEALDQAIIEQLQHLAHSTLLGQSNVPSVLLAEQLIAIVPDGLSRVFYSDSGATSVEIAIKMAVQFWKNQGISHRNRILGFTHNYHGDTLGAMAIAPDPVFHWPFGELLSTHSRAPYPYCYRCPIQKTFPECQYACLDIVDAILEKEHEQTAAIIIEPVEGAGGIIPAPPGYLKRLRQLADNHDVLLIVDEVATGFGRTGNWFASTTEDITPDILCVAKGITGGYLPLAATITTHHIFEQFLNRPSSAKGEESYHTPTDRTFYHGHSYTGNALASAVSLANIRLLRELIPQLAGKVQYIEQLLGPLTALAIVGDTRQKGFMVGLELVQNPSYPASTQLGRVVAQEARKRGLLIRPLGNVVVFMPPLSSTEKDLQEMVSILYESLMVTERGMV